MAHPIAVSYALPAATLRLSAYALIQRMNQGRKARVVKQCCPGWFPDFIPALRRVNLLSFDL
ncbi:MAG: hypothetical protein WCS94_02885 [Verrucomicrobiota bacterium]